MRLTIKQLSEATGESKSTIHYYLREGLLPEPEKPKPNVYRYDESSIERIKLIKYLQRNLGYSIAEIKSFFAKNNLNAKSSYPVLLEALAKMSGMRDMSEEDFLKEAGISMEDLLLFQKKEYIPKKPVYTEKDVEAAKILKASKEADLDMSLFDRYMTTAKKLAKKEYEVGADLLEKNKDNQQAQYELLFKIILTLKPYILNTQTVIEHKTKMEEK